MLKFSISAVLRNFARMIKHSFGYRVSVSKIAINELAPISRTGRPPREDRRVLDCGVYSSGRAELRPGPGAWGARDSCRRRTGLDLDNVDFSGLSVAAAPGVFNLAGFRQRDTDVLDVRLAQHKWLK